jgi:uncharacterized protein
MTTTTMAPISNKDRIQVIDILRGLALLGIILVNVHEISYSWLVTEVTGRAGDRWAQFIIDTFFVNKFYTLFSFLFGLGMAIQMVRAKRKGNSFIRLYANRLFWLLIFGLVHAIFIWDGDILATYALIGIFLLLLRNFKPKTLIILTIVLLVVQTGINIASLYLDDTWAAANPQNYLAEYQWEVDLYQNASYAEISANRLENTLEVENPWLNLLAPFYLVYERLDVLGAFLFGLAVGKLRWFDEIEIKLNLWKKIFRWAMPIGLGINIAGGILTYLGSTQTAITQLYDIGLLLLQLGATPLTLGYISGIVLLGRKFNALTIFASSGKMALTVYLTQSIILTLIFYSYGLGLFYTIGSAQALLLGAGIYVIQLIVSIIWMRYFRFGPVEWLWRSLTYRRKQPMKR